MLSQGKIKLQGVRQSRQFFWRIYGDTFFPPGLTRHQRTGRLADPKLVGDKCNQMLVGFAVDRRGLDSEL